MAYFTVYTFYASCTINLIIILGVTTMELVGSSKRLYARWCKRNSNNGEISLKKVNENSKSAILIDVKNKVSKKRKEIKNNLSSHGTTVEVVHLKKSLSTRNKKENQRQEGTVMEAVHL